MIKVHSQKATVNNKRHQISDQELNMIKCQHLMTNLCVKLGNTLRVQCSQVLYGACATFVQSQASCFPFFFMLS